jgi:ribonuclease Z
MSINITFLGTAGSVPTPNRNLSAIIIRRKNEQIMFDCGEGTQRQMIKAQTGFHKKLKILITHLHGDHVLGLPGLFQTMALMDRKKTVKVYGPVGIKQFIDCSKEVLKFGLSFPVEIFEIKPGIICEEREYKIKAIKSSHTEESLAFGFFENPRPGKFYPEKARNLGIPEGRLWSKLQNGNTVTLSSGKIIKPLDVSGPLRNGRTIIYTGDTRPIKNFNSFATHADLLIHEATFDDSLIEKAIADGHSTPNQAATEAKKAKAKKLILTHISARYPKSEILLEQAKPIFNNTIIANDFLEIEIPFIEN